MTFTDSRVVGKYNFYKKKTILIENIDTLRILNWPPLSIALIFQFTFF